MEKFVTTDLIQVFEKDSLITTRALSGHIETLEDISDVFDSISYFRG